MKNYVCHFDIGFGCYEVAIITATTPEQARTEMYNKLAEIGATENNAKIEVEEIDVSKQGVVLLIDGAF